MKKILSILVLVFLSTYAFAQAASLQIVNNTNCAAYVTMYAVCTDCNNASPCNLVSNSFYVAGSSTVSFTGPVNFGSSVGWAYTFGFLSPNCVQLSSHFQWTDARICFSDGCHCPGAQDGPWCTCVSAPGAACGVGGNCLGCGTSGTIPASVACVTSVTFAPTTGCFMDNVTITIN